MNDSTDPNHSTDTNGTPFAWSRWCEVLVGAWLIASPFVLGHPEERTAYWIGDFAAGGLTILFALLSILGRPSHAHVATLLVVAWLVGFGYFGGSTHPAPAALQNDLLTGLVLLMLAVIPTHNVAPPRAWVDFHESYRARRGADAR